MSKKRIAKMRYEFKAGARYSVAADVAGAELERIQNQRGVIEPRVVVEESRPEAAPLHPVFEWDDDKAAENYRTWQARSLIKSVRVIELRDGADFLAARRHALLGDKMGLGKTIQAIEACNITGARRLAVACPAIAKINWQREVEKWSTYGIELKVESYNKLATDKDLRNRWAAWRPDVLVLDEAHYLKSADSSRTKSMYGPHCRNNGLAGCAGAVWGLSGTLTPNNAAELFPHLRALFPQALPGGGTYADFLNTHT